MAQQIARNTVTYRDARGRTGKVSFYVFYDRSVAGSTLQGQGNALAIITALDALSNAAVVGIDGLAGETLPPNVYGAAPAVYQPASTKLRLRMLAADNTIHTFSIPAPILAAFEADEETALASAIAALVAALKNPVTNASAPCTKAGALFTASLGGQLTKRRSQRKLTIYDKSSNLDEPEE